MFAGMIARPRATSERTNSGVIGFPIADCQFRLVRSRDGGSADRCARLSSRSGGVELRVRFASAAQLSRPIFSRIAMNSISGVMMPWLAYASCVTGGPPDARSGLAAANLAFELHLNVRLELGPWNLDCPLPRCACSRDAPRKDSHHQSAELRVPSFLPRRRGRGSILRARAEVLVSRRRENPDHPMGRSCRTRAPARSLRFHRSWTSSARVRFRGTEHECRGAACPKRKSSSNLEAARYLAHEKVKLRKQEKRNFIFLKSPVGSCCSFCTKKSHARKNRMAEIASPASDPRSLRRHYPHQVQGVVQLDLSAIAAPPHC